MLTPAQQIFPDLSDTFSFRKMQLLGGQRPAQDLMGGQRPPKEHGPASGWPKDLGAASGRLKVAFS